MSTVSLCAAISASCCRSECALLGDNSAQLRGGGRGPLTGRPGCGAFWARTLADALAGRQDQGAQAVARQQPLARSFREALKMAR